MKDSTKNLIVTGIWAIFIALSFIFLSWQIALCSLVMTLFFAFIYPHGTKIRICKDENKYPNDSRETLVWLVFFVLSALTFHFIGLYYWFSYLLIIGYAELLYFYRIPIVEKIIKPNFEVLLNKKSHVWRIVLLALLPIVVYVIISCTCSYNKNRADFESIIYTGVVDEIWSEKVKSSSTETFYVKVQNGDTLTSQSSLVPKLTKGDTIIYSFQYQQDNFIKTLKIKQ